MLYVGLVITMGITAFHVVCIHACFYFVFESVTLEDKHRFKFGGVMSDILYHLERPIMA